jgi:hypothetical protein
MSNQQVLQLYLRKPQKEKQISSHPQPLRDHGANSQVAGGLHRAGPQRCEVSGFGKTERRNKICVNLFLKTL